MAFFGITSMGYQNTLKERVIPDFREGTDMGNLKYQTSSSLLKAGRPKPTPHEYLPVPVASSCPGVICEKKEDNPIEVSRSACCPQLFPPILPKFGPPSLSERAYEHGNSYKKLMDLRYRHVRSTKEPIEIYRYPVLTSHDIGRWRTREPIQKCEPWTKGPRYVYTESEMSKFVNKMALTNREFSLF